ncbi:MAG: TaqI-like C-terminal specificity domain-containing protein [Flavobacteriales bacterium]
MAFFQNSVLNKHLNGQDAEAVKAAYQKFTAYFHNPAIQQNIRDAKEEQFQEGFLRELFVDILGYTLNPQPNFNLTTELKNEKGAKKADGAILQGGKALGVIELKGTDTKDLDKINVQAFNYKNNQTGCVYVITSNFEKLRFFIHHSVEHLEFNLFTLTETEFQLLWLCLRADNLLNGVPLKVKEESLLEEEKITKQLYKDYAAFRNDMWQNMVKNSRAKDKLLLFKKTQKLLDRYLFIFFAEDSGLLPPNSISRIVKRWEVLKQEDAYKPLYDIFKQYFGYIDTGRKGQKTVDDIFAYNGGLFHPDEVLDSIKLDDEILHPHVMKLTNYDFQSEVDVNILGHIFENSLNEIENITAELEGQEIDKSKSKRKKDGVFYTPKYITKYIVDNTVGKLCDEKKAELGIIDEEYAKGRRNRKKETIKSLGENLQAYRNWLLNITICDPACGSGAFLNQALEFLMEEHAYVDELQAQLFGASIVFQDVSNHILEKNIFGVDINEESVDIAKLSLWLRTAQRGRKLTTLNNNIKCGNSLIDDPSVAGEKAFNWQKEFPTVFDKGGFDAVIGNPPYVRPRSLTEIQKQFIANNYKTAENQFDLYHVFIEKSEVLRNKKGIVSLILPNAFLANENSKSLRKYILENCHIQQIVDCKQDVFKDASVEVLIYVFDSNSEMSKYFELKNNFFDYKHDFITSSFLNNKNYNFTPTLSLNAVKLFQKVNTTSKKLEDEFDIMSGIKEYQTGKGKPPQIAEDKELRRFNASYKKDDSFVKEVRGKHVQRYSLDWEQEYVSYGKWLAEPRNPNYFKGKRFLMRQIPAKDSLVACFTNEEYVVDQSAYVIKPKDGVEINQGLLGILNSKLIFWYYRNENNEFDNLFPKIKAKEIRNLPIVNRDYKCLNEKVVQIGNNTNELREISTAVSNLILSKFEIEKLTNKLQNWYELEFAAFLKELKKAKVQLSLSEEAEWMQYFNEQKQKAQTLKSEINRVDAEIDKMVYELYGLNEEEIKIVEGEV